MITVNNIRNMNFLQGKEIMESDGTFHYAVVQKDGQTGLAKFTWDEEKKKWVEIAFALIGDIMDGDIKTNWKFWLGGIIIAVASILTDRVVDFAALFGLN